MPYDPDDPATDKAERQVRATAQTAIAARLRPDHPGFWPDARIDLSDARLIDVNFRSVLVRQFTADSATFSGAALFEGATFSEIALFDGATFGEIARFNGTVFGGSAEFDGTTFSGTAGFDEVTFNGVASFGKVTFGGPAGFGEAMFKGAAVFDQATFSPDDPPVWPEGFAVPAGIVGNPPDPGLAP